MKAKLTSLVLAAVMLVSAFGLCVTAEEICLHDTEKGLVKTDSGFTIANVCKLCGKSVTDIGYVDASKKITLYKEAAKTNKYSESDLANGIASAQGNGLYVDNGVISTSGTPYWLTFDLKVSAFPKLDEGDTQADLSNTDSRAYKGWSVICFCNNSYDAPLRFIADGWEDESGADGTSKGNADGIAPINFSKSNADYRFNEEVVSVSVGDKVSVALRVDPETGNYDAYVDGLLVGSGKVPTRSTDNTPFIRLWEWDSYNRGGLLDFTNIDAFYDNYTKAVHTHNFVEYTEFYDKGLYSYERCDCGTVKELEGEQITSVVADGLAHIYNGLGEFDVNSNNYWFVTDMNIRGEIGDGSLLKFGNDVILEVKEGKIVSGTSVLGTVNYPTTYQIAVEIENGSYNLYVNGRFAVSGTIADTNNITCGDEGFESHVRFMYNKAVTLGETAAPVIPTYTADKTAKICYHSNEETTARYKILAHTKDGVEYIYNCSLCGERVYSMLKKDLTNPANDIAYKNRSGFITRNELAELNADKPRYLYLENGIISKSAEPYWLTFDVTPKSLPSNETGDLNDPNSRVYKGYALVSTEPSFSPYAELQVIPDGWEEGNGNTTVKGVTDGKCEVKIIKESPIPQYKYNTQGYRFTETVAYLEVGKTTSFALRVDPKTGNYDVYVNGVYKASAQKMISDDLNPKITFHDNGMGEFTYSNISVCEEAQSFDDKIVAIEFDAKFEADETASVNAYTTLLAIERGEEKYNLFFVNNKNGTLEFKDENGKFNTLYNDKGEIVYLNEKQSLAVVYDDINGDIRYYAGGKLCKYSNGEKLAYANGIKVYNSEFVKADGSYDSLCFDIAKVTNLGIMGLGATDTAEVVGFQPNDFDDSIRLVSGLDSLYYGAVGYEVRAYMEDGTPYEEQPTVKSATEVYSSVIADNMPLPASKYGYNHFAAITIDGSFTGYKDSYIIVKPFTIIGNDKYYGEAVRLNILDNGSYEFAENN